MSAHHKRVFPGNDNSVSGGFQDCVQHNQQKVFLRTENQEYMAGYVDKKSDDHGVSDPEPVKQILQEHHEEILVKVIM